MYKYVLNSVVKIPLMFAQYIKYFKPVKDSEWTKKKSVDILHIVNLCTYFMTFNRYLLDRW